MVAKTDFGIEFFDFINQPCEIEKNPTVHHFRSSNIKSVLNELEKHWLSILDNNICIPTHEMLEGNEDEKVSYRKTTFLSDKILNNTSPATQILRKSKIVTEDFVEEDLTDFVLETVPNSGYFIRCGSSSSNNDLPSSSSSSNSYSNDLKSKEANAISFVLGEISIPVEKI